MYLYESFSVWHDNTGKEADWFLNSIIITDLETSKKYLFLCDSWLSNKKGNAKVKSYFKDTSRMDEFRNIT